MCIIIQRASDFTIPKDKFLAAVENNPHGYGISLVHGDGMLTTLRDVPDKTDGEELYDLIHGEFKSDQLMLHMRWNTAGHTTLRNTHPFPILELDKDGVDVRMCHNGTIHTYKPTIGSNNIWESDTRVFVREYVRPLFKRMIKGHDIKEIMEDKFIIGLLEGEIPGGSVLSFIDGWGNTLTVNPEGNGGKQEKDWYYSNVYSFVDGHRFPKPTSNRGSILAPYTPPSGPTVAKDPYTGYMGYGGYGSGYSASNDEGYGFQKDGKFGWVGYGNEKQYGAGGKVLYLPCKPKEDHAKDTKVTKFTSKYKLDGVKDLFTVTDDSLDTILDDAPKDLLLLCKELMAECLSLTIRVKEQAKKLKGYFEK